MSGYDLSFLARSELLRLAANIEHPAAAIPAVAGLREPDATRRALTRFVALDPSERVELVARLRALTAPEHPRMHPAHDDWVRAGLRRLPPGLHPTARGWLRIGGPPPSDANAFTFRAWQWCIRHLGAGPTHLPPVAHAPVLHAGHLAGLAPGVLRAVLDDLGMRVIAVTIARHGPRQRLAALASLDESHRREVGAYISAYETVSSELRARTQAMFIDVSRTAGRAGRARLLPTLALHMFAMAAGYRFELEVRFLAQRLPMPVATRLDRALANATRRRIGLVREARTVVVDALENVAAALGAERT